MPPPPIIMAWSPRPEKKKKKNQGYTVGEREEEEIGREDALISGV